MMSRGAPALVLSVLLAGLACVPSVGAQDKHRSSAASPRHKPAAAAKRRPPAKHDAKVAGTEPSKPAHAEAPSPSTAKPTAAADAEEAVHKEGDTEVKTLEFGGLDIEGQLRTPQMLYFLNRLRAEFERPQLPHRSFMPELQRSTKENAF
jgi:hypothetical protein